MKKAFLPLLVAILSTATGFSQPILQPNDFRIGAYEYSSTPAGGSVCGPVTTTYFNNNSAYPSSYLNTLIGDGFNAGDDYNASSIWTGVYGTENCIRLTQNVNATTGFNFRMLMNAKEYYEPPFVLSTLYNTWANGTNDYNDSGYEAYPNPTPAGQASSYYCTPGSAIARSDYKTLFSSVYPNRLYASTIWGYGISEEGCYDHPYVYSDRYYPVAASVGVPVPPSSVSGATGYFRSLLYAAGMTTPQKMCTAQANHGMSINDNTIAYNPYPGAGSPTYANNPNPQDYINPGLMGSNMPDVFFESSYFLFPSASAWYTEPYTNIVIDGTAPHNGNLPHYLGKFKSIDYALTKVSNVQAMNDVEGGEPNSNPGFQNHLIYEFHSNPAIPNANYLWLLTYGSIIHGVSGVWFWGVNQEFTTRDSCVTNNGTTTCYTVEDVGGYPNELYDYNYQQSTSQDSNLDRFTKKYFPYTYQYYVAPLAREIAYLQLNSLLSTDPSTVIYKKTDEADPNCIVPPASTYLPNAIATIPLNYHADHITENYGLRYTIRTSGSRTVMIISNVLPVPINNVTLNFNNLANPGIRNSTGVNVLFEGTFPTSGLVSTSTYKINRKIVDGYITLNGATPTSPATATFATGALGVAYTATTTFGGSKTLTLSFGPLDTHVIEFVNSSNTLPYTNDYQNGWEKIWSNNGSGQIAGVTINSTDQLLVGDFTGDGTQQIMDIQKGTASNAWAYIFKYTGTATTAGSWQIVWSNGGNNTIGGVQIQASAQYIAADLNGDGTDELLDIQQGTSGNWATVQELSGATWNWLWSNYGSNAIGGWSITAGDKYVTGDFLHKGYKQLMCIQDKSTGALANALEYNSGSWTSGWNNTSAPGYISGWGISSYDRYFAGDMSGDGYADRLVITNNNDSWSGILYLTNYSSAGPWIGWSGTNLAGLGSILPADNILIGNVDGNTSSEADIMDIQGSNVSAANYATTVNMVSGTPTWKWSNHNSPYTSPENGFINDWPVADPSGEAAQYLLFSPVKGGYPFLLASRVYANNGCNANNLISIYTPTCVSCGERPIAPTEQNTAVVSSVDMKVFPNPNNGRYTIDVVNTTDATANVEVYNLLGQVVKTISNYKLTSNADNMIELDMVDAPSGQYIVKCITENSVKVIKVVVNK